MSSITTENINNIDPNPIISFSLIHETLSYVLGMEKDIRFVPINNIDMVLKDVLLSNDDTYGEKNICIIILDLCLNLQGQKVGQAIWLLIILTFKILYLRNKMAAKTYFKQNILWEKKSVIFPILLFLKRVFTMFQRIVEKAQSNW